MAATSKNRKKLQKGSEESVGYLLRNLIHDLRRITESEFRDANLDLSMTQLGALFIIHTNPGLPGAQLAKRLFITAQSTTDVLKGLEQSGLLERKPHPDNLRAHRWFITDIGIDKLTGAFDCSELVLERMQSQLSKAEKAQFVDLLKRCILGLKDN